MSFTEQTQDLDGAQCQHRKPPPHRWREKVNQFLGPLSGLTQALSDYSVAGVEFTFHCFSVYSVLCGFLGDFLLCILATDSHIVSGWKITHFEGTTFMCHFCFPCFSMAQGQVPPYPPPGCRKSRGVMISRQTFQNSHSETEQVNIASEALLKSCGEPLAIILISTISGIGSLQTNWHLGVSPGTWIHGISMLQVNSPAAANGGSQGKLVRKILLVGLWKITGFLAASLCFCHKQTGD